MMCMMYLSAIIWIMAMTLPALADLLTPDDIPTPAVLLQARRNAQWRAWVAETYGLLTGAEVAEVLGSTASNRAAVASRLASQRTIFGVPHKGNRVLYPAFQFRADGSIVPVIAEALAILAPLGYGGFELLSWFTSANPVLDGASPADRLDDVDDVLAAARDEIAPVGF
ncbi:hypothetical protein BH23ACT9_BH23ACT9_06770 [soil metagenome]